MSTLIVSTTLDANDVAVIRVFDPRDPDLEPTPAAPVAVVDSSQHSAADFASRLGAHAEVVILLRCSVELPPRAQTSPASVAAVRDAHAYSEGREHRGVWLQSLGRRKGNPAMRSPLEPDVQLDVLLSAICARNQYTRDAEPVIAELVQSSVGREDVLARVAGTWSGFFESAETRNLVSALRRIPGADLWVAEGRRRRGILAHGAPIRRPTSTFNESGPKLMT
ncbi:hypothetical protein [Microbacterium sp. AISO3]|uniref:hypothetical protein n=1 Tax=Microbacterium sp. AISO3 TaxID=2002831 RepID=UPI001131AA56|nr:hypothetical protein [Microbacterium sp. AISO3]